MGFMICGLLFVYLSNCFLLVVIPDKSLGLLFSTPDNKWMFLPPGSGLQAQTFHYIDGTGPQPEKHNWEKETFLKEEHL